MIVAYLMPEFPGQTHIWMWREICHLREWGCDIRLFSTRRPSDRDRARHAFAQEAARTTRYLTGHNAAAIAAAVLWAVGTRPVGLLRAVARATTLPLDTWRGRATAVALVAPACLLARELEAAGAAHLHCHACSNSAVLGMLVKRIIGIQFSMNLNASLACWGGAMAQKMGDARFTAAVAQWLVDQAHRDFPQLPAGKVFLAHTGVDTRRWTPRPPTPSTDGGDASASGEAWPPSAGLRLVSTGRLHRLKGFGVLLDAVRLLTDRGIAVSLAIIGGGPEQDALVARAKALGLTDRVRFLGSLGEEQVIEVSRAADVFVLATEAEALGVVFMEAMALGLATVGTNVGGVPEIITDGVNGLLVNPGDAGALADALGRLARDPVLRARLGQAARACIVNRFDSRIGAAQLFERLTGHPPLSAGTDASASCVATAT